MSRPTPVTTARGPALMTLTSAQSLRSLHRSLDNVSRAPATRRVDKPRSLGPKAITPRTFDMAGLMIIMPTSSSQRVIRQDPDVLVDVTATARADLATGSPVVSLAQPEARLAPAGASDAVASGFPARNQGRQAPSLDAPPGVLALFGLLARLVTHVLVERALSVVGAETASKARSEPSQGMP